MSDPNYEPSEVEITAAAEAIWTQSVRLPLAFAQADQQEYFLNLAAVALIAAHKAANPDEVTP